MDFIKGNFKFIGGDEMVAWYWVIVALMAGVFIGWLFCSLAWAANDAECNQPRPKSGGYIK